MDVKLEQKKEEICALCGEIANGWAMATDNKRLCHSAERDCYHQWTVYGKRPSPELRLTKEALSDLHLERDCLTAALGQLPLSVREHIRLREVEKCAEWYAKGELFKQKLVEENARLQKEEASLRRLGIAQMARVREADRETEEWKAKADQAQEERESLLRNLPGIGDADIRRVVNERNAFQQAWGLLKQLVKRLDGSTSENWPEYEEAKKLTETKPTETRK